MLRNGLIALLVIALPVAADVYKWVDERGEVHYSDTPPPPDANVKEQLQVPTPAQPENNAKPVAPSNSAAEQEMEFRKRQAERDKAEAEAQAQGKQAEVKRQNCERAQKDLAGLQAGTQLNRYGPDGEKIYLTDAEIAAAIVKAQTVVNSWCK